MPELATMCPKEMVVFGSDGVTSYREYGADSLLGEAQPIKKDYAAGMKVKALETRGSYMQRIDQVIEHIRKGDSFQVNLSQGFGILRRLVCIRGLALHLLPIAHPLAGSECFGFPM